MMVMMDDDDDDDDDEINKEYNKIVYDYENDKIKHKEIKSKLDKTNEAIKLYKKNKELFNKIPEFESKMNKNKKFAKIFKKVLNEIINSKICKKSDIITKVIDVTWINDPKLFNKINKDVTDRYLKDKKSPELSYIQSFLDDKNNEYIKNKKDAFKEFKYLKNNVKSKDLKDIVKELEFSIFGYEDDESKKEPLGFGLKILTNKQMLNRLPILLAQIQAANNSKSLKIE